MNWFISTHADYHDLGTLRAINGKGRFKTIELGCFPVRGQACCSYYALSYQGQKPSADSVVQTIQELSGPLSNEDYERFCCWLTAAPLVANS